MRSKTNWIYYSIVVVLTAGLGSILAYMELLIGVSFLSIVILFLVYFFIALELSIIIHEFGHLCLGLLTGYSFVSYRYRSFLWKKDESNKLVMMRYSLTGTGGQCLMFPPNTEEVPVYLYNAGGVIFNNLQAFISVALVLLLPKVAMFSLFLLVLAFVGLVLGFINWMDSKGLTNDGRNHRDMKRSNRSKEALLIVLRANALMSEGKLLSTIPLGEHDFSYYDKDVAIEYNLMAFMSDQSFNRLEFERGFTILEELKKSSLGIMMDHLVNLEYYMMMLMVDVDKAKDFYVENKKSIELGRKLVKTQPTYELVKMFEGVYLDGVYDEKLMLVFSEKSARHPLPGSVNDSDKILGLFTEAISNL